MKYANGITPTLVSKAKLLAVEFKNSLSVKGNSICSYDYKVVEGNFLLSVVVVQENGVVICGNYHPARKAVQETYRLENKDRYEQHKETLASLTRLYQS